MDLLHPIKRFDRFQQVHPAWAIPVAVIRKFGNDQAGSLAALIAYYAFFSIFPLLLVFTTILAFVLQGNTELYNDVTNSVLAQFPVVGDQLHAHALSGKITALVLGLLTSLWAGLGVTQAAQNAFNKVWAVPFKDRPDFFRSRLRGLLLLGSLGVLFMASAVAHRSRDHGRRAARQGRRVRGHARGQLRSLRRRVPIPDRSRASRLAPYGSAPRWALCSSRSSSS